MAQKFRLWVGIDWASEAHEISLVNEEGKVFGQYSVEHSGTGLNKLVDLLTRLCDGKVEQAAVAIEVPRGAVVETLMDRGFRVFSINPKQLDRFRDRHSVAGAKDDRRDAFVLADSLRTDQHCFREVRLDDPIVIQLREITRATEHLKADLRRCTNRLREQLHRYYPQLLGLCPAADEPWFWALLQLAPTPTDGAHLRPGRVKSLLKRHHIRRFTGDELLAALRTPPLHVAPGVVEAATEAIALLLPRAVLMSEQVARCEKRITTLLEELEAQGQNGEHHDARILLSLPGVGPGVAATMLAEASQPLADRDYHCLRSRGGAAPVTRQSGKGRSVSMRRACNAQLRNALHHWAWNAVLVAPRFRARYDALRQRGHGHPRALRSVADALLRVLAAMLKERTLYDETRGKGPATQAAA